MPANMPKATESRRRFEMWALGLVRSMGATGAVAYARTMAELDPEPQLWNRAATYIACLYLGKVSSSRNRCQETSRALAR